MWFLTRLVYILLLIRPLIVLIVVNLCKTIQKSLANKILSPATSLRPTLLDSRITITPTPSQPSQQLVGLCGCLLFACGIPGAGLASYYTDRTGHFEFAAKLAFGLCAPITCSFMLVCSAQVPGYAHRIDIPGYRLYVIQVYNIYTDVYL